jgi:YD repeat-containing protein
MPCNGWYPNPAHAYQAWTHRVWYNASGNLIGTEFRNNATGRCLDDSGAGLRTMPCNAVWGGFQAWRVTSV